MCLKRELNSTSFDGRALKRIAGRKGVEQTLLETLEEVIEMVDHSCWMKWREMRS